MSYMVELDSVISWSWCEMQTDVFHCIYIWQIWFVFMKPFEAWIQMWFLFHKCLEHRLWPLKSQLPAALLCMTSIRKLLRLVFVKLFSEVFVNLLSKVFLMWNQWTIFAPIFVIHLNTFWERFRLNSLPIYSFAYSSFSKAEAPLFRERNSWMVEKYLILKSWSEEASEASYWTGSTFQWSQTCKSETKNTFCFMLGRLDD